MDSEEFTNFTNFSTNGVELSDTLNDWRKKANGVVEKINSIDTDISSIESDITTINSNITTLEDNVGDASAIDTNAIGLSKLSQISGAKVLGRTSSGLGNVSTVDILDDDTFTNPSATSLATQQSIKAYVDGVNTSLTSYVNNKVLADFVSDWTQVEEDDTDFTITHNLGTQDIYYIMQLRFPNGQVTQLNPMLTYPYSDVNKPQGISVMITTTQFLCRTGRGLAFWRTQTGTTVGVGTSDTGGQAGYTAGTIDYNDDRTDVDFRIIAFKI